MKVLLREVLANWVLLPAIDALADPENLNTLIELCTHHQHELSQEANSVHVPILYSWVTPTLTVQGSQDPLKPSLEEVLNDRQLLYLFMQHIKETGPVNLLQFCLDIGELIIILFSSIKAIRRCPKFSRTSSISREK